eukprot:scaffold648_cov247-Pinguiococcus_pyrenoidosus.AAC.3
MGAPGPMRRGTQLLWGTLSCRERAVCRVGESARRLLANASREWHVTGDKDTRPGAAIKGAAACGPSSYSRLDQAFCTQPIIPTCNDTSPLR